jgi:hypothetical protein
VGCSHAAGCPLFPLLNASLQGWRDYYCDSAEGWRDCARYKVSLTGDRVPISLLPNGHHAMHLRHPQEAGRPGSSRDAATTADPAAADPSSPFEPAPAPAADPSSPARNPQPLPQPQDDPPRNARRTPGQAPDPRRGLWARLADWMGGPA